MNNLRRRIPIKVDFLSPHYSKFSKLGEFVLFIIENINTNNREEITRRARQPRRVPNKNFVFTLLAVQCLAFVYKTENYHLH